MDTFLIFCLVVGAIIAIAVGVSKGDAIAKAKSQYDICLQELAKTPTNATLRQRTLELGRIYSNLSRQQKGVTLFDEIALMNDINAACAGHTSIVPGTHAAAPTQTVTDRMAQLQAMKERGLITDTEFQAKRAELIAQL